MDCDDLPPSKDYNLAYAEFTKDEKALLIREKKRYITVLKNLYIIGFVGE